MILFWPNSICSTSLHTTRFSTLVKRRMYWLSKNIRSQNSKFPTLSCLKYSKLTMKLCMILATISFCIGFYSCLYIDSALNQPVDDESVVLKQIITNFFTKYFSDDQIFVSLIILPSKRDQNRDFFYSLFNNNQASAEFSYNILDKLHHTTQDNRNSLNLFVIDDSKQLQ